MKKPLTILFLFFSLYNWAQRPFMPIKPGTEWYQEKYCFEGGECNQIMVCGKMYLSDEDTIIPFDVHPVTQDTIWYNPPREYKIFYANTPSKQKACIIDPGHCGCELQIGQGGPCINNDTNTFAKYGFIRQDSINKKIYFRGCYFNFGDTLLYDFNKTVGDTIFPGDVFVYNSCELNGGTYSILTEMDSILGTDGIYRREYKFGSSMSIIEGVGSNSGFLTYNGGQCNGSKVVSVYTPSGDTLYKDLTTCSYPNRCSIIITSVAEESIPEKIKIFPNPASDFIIFQTEENVSSLLIIQTLLGQTVVSTTNESVSGTIDISAIPNGIYLYTIKSQNRRPQTGKLIILH